MTPLHLVPRDTRTTIWITAGHDGWRVTSNRMTYGEFTDITDARALLWLLILGNPERFKGIDE